MHTNTAKSGYNKLGNCFNFFIRCLSHKMDLLMLFQKPTCFVTDFNLLNYMSIRFETAFRRVEAISSKLEPFTMTRKHKKFYLNFYLKSLFLNYFYFLIMFIGKFPEIQWSVTFVERVHKTMGNILFFRLIFQNFKSKSYF